MRTPGKIDYLGEDVLGEKEKMKEKRCVCVGGGGGLRDHHRSTMCHLEGAFPHDLRWFSAYAAKWLGVSSDNEIEIINDSSRDSVNHVNFFRNKISYA